MYSLIKSLLFKKDPERIHYWVMAQLHKWNNTSLGRMFIRNSFAVQNPALKTNLFGLEFSNPVGLAAGFDKDAKFIDDLAALGFGYVEIGTLTPRPQDGNDKPRLFRLPEDNALINRMGFNNEGVDAAVERLKKRKSDIIIGGNIGKNKTTPNEKAIEDYEYCFRKLYDHVDYFVVNVSSPNTPNLRDLQEKEPLQHLLQHLQGVNQELGGIKPILLKIAPDLSEGQLDDIIDIVAATGISGLVATNTTISREGLATAPDEVHNIGMGGLSGQPLKAASTRVIRYIQDKSKGSIPVIGVGGIATAADAREKLAAGASLLQVYTGFIYEGPAIVKRICKGIHNIKNNTKL